MNREILICFLKEHEAVCPRISVSRRFASKGGCFLCTNINRDTLLLITRISGARKSVDVGLAFSPLAEPGAYRPYVTAGFKIYEQNGATESERIENVFDHAFGSGYSSVVVLASGAPNIPLDYLDEAIVNLRNGRGLILGPLRNGKFYLIGMDATSYALLKEAGLLRYFDFEKTEERERVLDRIKNSGIPCSFLPEWYIIRSFQDLKRLKRDAARGVGWKARWTSFLADVLV